MRPAQASLRQRHRDQGEVSLSEQLTVEQQISQRQAAAESQGDVVDLADESEPTTTKRVKREASHSAAAAELSPDEPSVHVSQEEPRDTGVRAQTAATAYGGVAPLTPRAASAATAAPPTPTPVARVALCEEQLGLSNGGRPLIHRLKELEEQVGVTGSGLLPPRIAAVEAALGLGSPTAHYSTAAAPAPRMPPVLADAPPRPPVPPPPAAVPPHASAAAAAAVPPPAPAAADDGRTWLSVSFSQKDEAKALGARFDGDEKRWYVPAGRDPTPLLARWPPREDTYLQVPFAKKDEAKAMGARWDPLKKAWYAPASRDPAPFLGKWPRWSGPVGYTGGSRH